LENLPVGQPLARLLGREPATVDPAFLDKMRDEPNQSFR